MLVICCGMQRSGSTLQYQMACAIVEALGLGAGVGWDWSSVREEMSFTDRPIHIVKVHQPNLSLEARLHPRCVRYIYCHRDIRDVIVSLIDKYGAMDDDTLVRHVREFAIEPYRHFTSRPGALVSRYDDLREHLAGEVARIEGTIGVALSPADREAIASRLSLDKQRAFIGARDWSDGREWDAHTLLHHNHIADGRTGKWRERLSERQLALIEAHAGDWLREHGYQEQEAV